MLLSATSEALARLRVSDVTAAAPCGPSLFEHMGFCKQGGPVLDTSQARRVSGSWRMAREAGEWQQAGGDQQDRAAQKVFARAGSRKPCSDQHQECSTTDNHGYGGLGGAGPTTSLVVGARGGSDRRPGAGTQMVSPATGRRSQGPKFRSLELSGEPLVGRLCARGEGYRARRELRGVSYG